MPKKVLLTVLTKTVTERDPGDTVKEITDAVRKEGDRAADLHQKESSREREKWCSESKRSFLQKSYVEAKQAEGCGVRSEQFQFLG